MLLFEFFPLFVMLVSVAVGVWLFMLDRQARRRSDD
jgi:preprotein translocase subunit YajC